MIRDTHINIIDGRHADSLMLEELAAMAAALGTGLARWPACHKLALATATSCGRR